MKLLLPLPLVYIAWYNYWTSNNVIDCAIVLEEEDSEKNWEQEGHGEVLYHGSQKGPTRINRTEQVQLGFNTVGLGYENLLYRVLVKTLFTHFGWFDIKLYMDFSKFMLNSLIIEPVLSKRG